MSHDANSRIIRLEQHLKPPVCPACLGRPHHLTWIDNKTAEVVSETGSEAGCEACGTAVFREYVIVLDDVPLRPVP